MAYTEAVSQTVTTHDLVELLSMGWRWAEMSQHLIDPGGRIWAARCLPDHRYDLRLQESTVRS